MCRQLWGTVYTSTVVVRLLPCPQLGSRDSLGKSRRVQLGTAELVLMLSSRVFNAYSVMFGIVCTDQRGKGLYALSTSLRLVVVNTGRDPTFFLKENGSIVKAASGRIRDWGVQINSKNVSDHHHITHS